jgi:hypothetical protein
MGVRASAPLANATPVNTGVLSKVFHMYKGQTLFGKPFADHNPYVPTAASQSPA